MTLHGLDSQIDAFMAAMGSGRLHHAWLLAGPRGVGKGSFAEAAARILLPGSESAALLDAGSHPDFLRLEPLIDEKTGKKARSIKVDQVRWLKSRLAQSTALGGYRAVVIDTVEELEGKSGPNALLKSLEEPSSSTVFLLISHAPGRLLPTIRSRCRTLAFGRLSDDAMTAILAEQLPEADPRPLIAMSNGSIGTALGYAGHDVASLDTALETLATTGDPTNAQRSALAQSLANKVALPRYESFLQRAPAFIAERARGSSGRALEIAIDRWQAARTLAAIAVPQSLVAETVVFEMAGYVAALAPEPRNVKA